MNHPFHIHGQGVYLLGMGQHPDGLKMTRAIAKAMYEENLLPIKRLGHIPPMKDTISIPSRGYAVVRFRATNPGKYI